MSDEPIYDYVDEESAEKAAEKERKRIRDAELDDVRAILKSLYGRRFYLRILREGKVFSTTHTGEANGSAFLEGHRNLALKFFNDVVEACPEMVPVLLAEGKDNVN